MSKEILGSLEINRIYQMSCIEGMKLIPGRSISLIATDPPYGKDYKSNWSNTFEKIDNDNNLNWLENLFLELNRITKNDSHLYCFSSAEYLGEFILEIKKYWKIKNIITIPRTMKGGIGDLKSSFSPQNEYAIFATKGSRPFEETQILKPSEVYMKDKRKKPKEWLYRLPDYWDWLKVSEHNLKRKHPTQKTVDVMETMIQLSSKEDELVIDPFMGSGTTAVACLKNNRKFIGFETESKYIEVANKRIESTYNELDDKKLLD
jgi:site-specific DNA-methyltransferase (adenine-specific)